MSIFNYSTNRFPSSICFLFLLSHHISRQKTIKYSNHKVFTKESDTLHKIRAWKILFIWKFKRIHSLKDLTSLSFALQVFSTLHRKSPVMAKIFKAKQNPTLLDFFCEWKIKIAYSVLTFYVLFVFWTISTAGRVLGRSKWISIIYNFEILCYIVTLYVARGWNYHFLLFSFFCFIFSWNTL